MRASRDAISKWFLVTAGAAMAVWIFWLVLCLSTSASTGAPEWWMSLFELPGQDDQTLDRRAKLGDAFGAFNALISTLALSTLLVTFNLQRLQLRQQQRQFRSESRLIRQQQFQEQFFSAIDGYQAQLESIAVGARASEKSGEQLLRTGRGGLYCIVDEELREAMIASPDIGECLAIQRQGGADVAQWHAELSELVRVKGDKLMADPETRSRVLSLLGRSWAAIYFRHRFQLDALFRAWYTVYRILDTAPSYRLTAAQIHLYGASFRARLSWVELFVLLLNQAGLPFNTHYPNARGYSNTYRVFDNLSTESDIIARMLRDIAVKGLAATDVLTPLSAAAFAPAQPPLSPDTDVDQLASGSQA